MLVIGLGRRLGQLPFWLGVEHPWAYAVLLRAGEREAASAELGAGWGEGEGGWGCGASECNGRERGSRGAGWGDGEKVDTGC